MCVCQQTNNNLTTTSDDIPTGLTKLTQSQLLHCMQTTPTTSTFPCHSTAMVRSTGNPSNVMSNSIPNRTSIHSAIGHNCLHLMHLLQHNNTKKKFVYLLVPLFWMALDIAVFLLTTFGWDTISVWPRLDVVPVCVVVHSTALQLPYITYPSAFSVSLSLLIF